MLSISVAIKQNLSSQEKYLVINTEGHVNRITLFGIYQ